MLTLTLLGKLLTAVPAMAQTAAPAAGGAPSPIMSLVPFIFVLGIMYFLMIRPQMNRQKAHQTFVSSLKRGDEVLTSSGILGTIEGLTEVFVTLEIAPGVRIKVLRNQVMSYVPTAPAAANKEVKA